MLLKYYHVEVLGKSLREFDAAARVLGDDEDNDGEEVAQDPKKELARLRQSGDNTLSISIRLLSDKNIRNMDILLQITAPTEADHNLRAKNKSNPTQHVRYCVDSIDGYQRVLMQTMAQACINDIALRTMGMVRQRPLWIDEGFAQDQRDRCSIALNYAHCLVRERGVDLMIQNKMPPGSFAALLSLDPARQQIALQEAEFEWNAILWLEKNAQRSEDWVGVLKLLPFFRWPAYRTVYMLLEVYRGPPRFPLSYPRLINNASGP